MTIGVCDILA